jgi:hypothetical protein
LVQSLLGSFCSTADDLSFSAGDYAHFKQLADTGEAKSSAQTEADEQSKVYEADEQSKVQSKVYLDSYWKRLEAQTAQAPYIPEVQDVFDGSLYEDFYEGDFQEEQEVVQYTGDSAVFRKFPVL